MRSSDTCNINGSGSTRALDHQLLPMLLMRKFREESVGCLAVTESSKLTTEMIFRLGNYDTCRVLYILQELEMEVAQTSRTSHYGISYVATGVGGCYGGA